MKHKYVLIAEDIFWVNLSDTMVVKKDVIHGFEIVEELVNGKPNRFVDVFVGERTVTMPFTKGRAIMREFKDRFSVKDLRARRVKRSVPNGNKKNKV